MDRLLDLLEGNGCSGLKISVLSERMLFSEDEHINNVTEDCYDIVLETYSDEEDDMIEFASIKFEEIPFTSTEQLIEMADTVSAAVDLYACALGAYGELNAVGKRALECGRFVVIKEISVFHKLRNNGIGTAILELLPGLLGGAIKDIFVPPVILIPSPLFTYDTPKEEQERLVRKYRGRLKDFYERNGFDCLYEDGDDTVMWQCY